MQGSYSKDGLPRPYNMKPRKPSVYDSMSAKPFFTTPRRKIIGYLVLLSLVGTLMYFVAQDLRFTNSEYDLAELAHASTDTKNGGDSDAGINPVDSLDSHKAKNDASRDAARGGMKNGIPGSLDDEKLAEKVNVDLAKLNEDAMNAVVEAPKGGIANEANVVGTDKDQLIAGAKPAAARQKNGSMRDDSKSDDGKREDSKSGEDIEVNEIRMKKAKAKLEALDRKDVGQDAGTAGRPPKSDKSKEKDLTKLNEQGEPALVQQGRNAKAQVVEAPKGGVANEANVVGNDEEELIGRPKPPSPRYVRET